MNEQIKTRWAGALRSKNYKQGTGYLHTRSDGKDYYCCLGVLCELAVADGVVVRDQSKGGHFYYGAEGEAQVLPSEVREWAGLNDRSPELPGPEGDIVGLADENDNGASFDEIAAWIEEGL